MLKLLLDTHALIWWALDHPKLSTRVRAAIQNSMTEVYVSAASAWEIATKVRIGKLQWPSEASTVQEYVREQGFEELAITLEHAERAGAMAIAHRDPFDRMLIAQATARGFIVASNEAVFDEFGVQRLW